MLHALRMLIRAALLRCPQCGDSFRRGLRLLPACQGCGLRLERGERDHFLGSLTFNIIGSEMVVLAILVWSVARFLPDSPPFSVYLAGIGSALAMPVLFYPFSKTLWLAFDLVFRPARPSDFST